MQAEEVAKKPRNKRGSGSIAPMDEEPKTRATIAEMESDYDPIWDELDKLLGVR